VVIVRVLECLSVFWLTVLRVASTVERSTSLTLVAADRCDKQLFAAKEVII